MWDRFAHAGDDPGDEDFPTAPGWCRQSGRPLQHQAEPDRSDEVQERVGIDVPAHRPVDRCRLEQRFGATAEGSLGVGQGLVAIVLQRGVGGEHGRA